MNGYLLTGITMICAGKAQQFAGWLAGSRNHQILGFDLELRGKNMIVLGQTADRTAQGSPQLLRVRAQDRRQQGQVRR